MSVELVVDVVAEVCDLTADEAEELTSVIRQWVAAYPIDAVTRAYKGRIWLALAYDSWDEWCECELGGFQLPQLERQKIVVQLASTNLGTDEAPAYMSNTAIASATGVSDPSIIADLDATSKNLEVDLRARPILGQDGRVLKPRKKRDRKPDVAMTPQSEADLINTVAGWLGGVLRPDRIALYSPAAKEHFIRILETAINTLKEQP